MGVTPDLAAEIRRLSQGERTAQHGMRNLKTIFAPSRVKEMWRELIYQFIDTSAAEFPISVLCEVCKVSRSGY